MVLRAGFKKKLRLYVELKIYDKNRRKITDQQCVNTDGLLAMPLGKGHQFQKSYKQCISCYSYCLKAADCSYYS
jgi:hypothetical protein